MCPVRKEVILAAAARTPLYLPLYVAESFHFFELQKDYDVQIQEPQAKDKSGDEWAAKKLIQEEALFAVCDPKAAEDHPNGRVARIVAAVINRAAFWGVTRSAAIRKLSDFSKFSTIVTYPSRMTAHRIAEAIAAYFGKELRIEEAQVDCELEPLRQPANDGYVAITANLLYAKGFAEEEENESLQISEVWSLHPSLHTYLLTGLISRRDVLETDPTLVTGLVKAIHRASAIIRTDERKAAEILRSKYQAGGVTISVALSAKIVRDLTRHRVYPTTPFADLTGWHNAHLVNQHKTFVRSATQGSVQRLDQHSESYDKFVSTTSAVQVENESLKYLIRFAQSDLNLVRRLQALKTLNLQELRVVRHYSRFDENIRNVLRQQLDRIERALENTSRTRENFLIWGGSGAGKSYLVQQLAEDLVGKITYKEANLAAIEKETFVAILSSAKAEDRATLCFVDEIDCNNAILWGYDSLYSVLDKRMDGGKPIVFVMAGSKCQNIDDLSRYIASHGKGSDVMTRIPEDRRFEIPPASIEDRVAIVAAQTCMMAEELHRKLRDIEKLALYYILANSRLEKPRQVREIVAAALSRIPIDQERMRYDHLFDEADREKQQTFWTEHIAAVEDLANTYVKLADTYQAEGSLKTTA